MNPRIRLRIDEVLKERGQSMYWLARNTGVSYTTLWRLTKDRALGINFATLEKLCLALSCAPGELVELTTSRSKGKPAASRTPSRNIRRTSTLL